MIINERFRLLQPEDDDRSLVQHLGIYYHFNEVGSLIGLLEDAREQERQGYLNAGEVGDIAMQAYYGDIYKQMNELLDTVGVAAGHVLAEETEYFLSN